MTYRILAVNPGSTSTKIAVYQDDEMLFREDIEHAGAELERFEKITDQFEFRKEHVLRAMGSCGIKPEDLSAAVGRGGLLPPVKAGGYLVSEAMKRRITEGPIIPHASNLGALIADAIAAPAGKPAYIYDAVSADELSEVARVTGIPEISRQSFCHVLNSKATARKVAAKHGKKYSDMNLIVAHLGGGISISAHEKGRITDVIGDDAGPFSPERAGSIPLTYIVDMCYSARYTKSEMLMKLRGMGGIRAHLGTSDCRLVEKMIGEGNLKAKLVYEAQAYQIAKGIGELSPVLKGAIDFIILTGGLARSEMLTGMVRERIVFIAPVEIVPGEQELEALALGALRILRGEEDASVYSE